MLENNTIDNKFIGFKIKELRQKQNMTQKDLAKIIGKTESSVQKYERGVAEVPLSVLCDIANALHVSILVLLDIPHLTQLAQTALDNGNIDFADFILDIANLQYDKKYSEELRLEVYYELLNEDGKKKLLEYAKLLCDSDDYRLPDELLDEE